MPESSAKEAGTLTIGSDLVVNRLGYGAMRLTGNDLTVEEVVPSPVSGPNDFYEGGPRRGHGRGRRAGSLARLIERAGPFRLPKLRQADPFLALAQAIVHQQLAGPAAAAIWSRVAALVPGGLTPDGVLAAPDTAFRAAGLSSNKTLSIKDLAAKVLDGTVPLARLRRMPDDEIVQRLSVVRGIGRWTAEMFLIFQLRRMNVWPVLDFGVRKGWAVMHGLAEIPTPKALEPEGDRFRPFRTVVAGYCWRAVILGAEAAPAAPA